MGNERDDGLNRRRGIVYWPLHNDRYEREAMADVVRSSRVGTASFMRRAPAAVWSVNPNLPLSEVETLDRSAPVLCADILRHGNASESVVSRCFSVVGIYGVIGTLRAQRTARSYRMRSVRDWLMCAAILRHGLLADGRRHRVSIAAALAVLACCCPQLLFGVRTTDPISMSAVRTSRRSWRLSRPTSGAPSIAVDSVIALRADV